MKFNIVFLQSEEKFSLSQKKEIRKIIRKEGSAAAKILSITGLMNFTVYPFDSKYIGGYTQAVDWIRITISLKKHDKNDLRALVNHEMHHTVRGWYPISNNEQKTLLDALFAEGLAASFESEQVPEWKAPYQKYTKVLIHRWLPYVKKEVYSINYDYEAWFWGKGKPMAIGYKIGIYLVDEILKNNPSLSHKDLFKKSSKELLKLSKIKL